MYMQNWGGGREVNIYMEINTPANLNFFFLYTGTCQLVDVMMLARVLLLRALKDDTCNYSKNCLFIFLRIFVEFSTGELW